MTTVWQVAAGGSSFSTALSVHSKMTSRVLRVNIVQVCMPTVSWRSLLPRPQQALVLGVVQGKVVQI